MNTIPRLQPASSVREVRRSERVDAFILSEVAYPPGFRIDWHSHELAALALTVRGSSTESFTNAQFKNTETGMLFRPAGERHCDSVGSQGATCFLIEVGRTWIEQLPQLASVLKRPRFHECGSITRLALRAYREWLLNDTASSIAIQALVLEIAARLIRETDGRACFYPPIWLRQVKQRLDDNFVETPSLAELARFAGVHPTHLARHFRRHYRVSIGEYLRARRVDAAIKLLSWRGLSLTEIALESGFSSHGHLCTIFQRATGMTPREFRAIRR
jgi:AraC family transcriptional regulator